MVHARHELYQQVAQKVTPHSELLRVWDLQGGISAQMTAIEIELPDGGRQKLVVRCPHPEALRQNPLATDHEFRLLQVLRSVGLAVPAPFGLDTSGEVLAGPYLVLEYVEGVLDFAPANPDDYVRQMADHLAAIHRLDGSRGDLSFLPRQAAGCTEAWWGKPALAEEAFGSERIRQAMVHARPPAQRHPSVLLHGDYWPGNILWRDGRLAAVVDWEDARLGDPLVDLGKSRLEVAWIFGLEPMEAFTRHYRSHMALDESDLPYWDLCAALRLMRIAGPDLAEWAAFFAPFGRPDITEQTMRADYVSFVGQALAALAP